MCRHRAPARAALLLLALSLTGFGWGSEDRLDNPISRGLSLAQLLHRRLFVDFVRRDDACTWRLDEEVYTDQRVIGVLMDNYSVGSSQRISARYERQSRLAASVRSPIVRPQRRPDGVLIAQHPIQGCIRVAVEDYPDLAERFDVTTVPTFLVIDESGNVVARHEGFLTADRLESFLREAIPPPPATEAAAAPVPVAPVAPAARPAAVPGLEELSIGQARTGRITRATNRVEYLLPDGPRPVRLTLQTLTSNIDLDLAVLPLAGGAEAASLAEGTSPNGTEEVVTDATGAVRVRVFYYGGELPEGGVSFTVGADTLAPAAGLSEATELPMGGPVWGRVGEGVWERYYSYTPPAGRPYTLRLAAAETTVDIDLEVLDANGNLLARSNGGTGVEEIIRTEETASRRLARVYAYTPTEAANYTLSLTSGSNPMPRPSGRTTPTAPSADIVVGTAATGRLEAGGEMTYRFRVPRGGLFSFLLVGDEGAGDMDLAVLSTDGENLATSQGGAANEAILLRLEEGREVVVRVYAYALTTPSNFRVWIQSAE